MSLEETLASTPLMASLDRKTLKRLAEEGKVRTYAPGEVIVREGAPASALYIITRGTVRVEKAVGDDSQQFGTLGPGDFFGEIALLDGGPRTATVTADEPSRLLVLTHREFHSMMEEFPEVAAEVLNSLAHRIRRLEPDQPH